MTYVKAITKYEENVRTLLSEMSADAQGDFSASIYETARLVGHAPSLRGHGRRVRFLLDEQHHDGGWGGPEEYGLVPTLSAVAALLAVLRSAPPDPDSGPEDTVRRDELVRAVDCGLRALHGRLAVDGRAPLPDTVAVEIVVPGLISEINDHLHPDPPVGLAGWRDCRLAHPAGENVMLLHGLRGALVEGQALPAKLAHTLEVFGDAALGAGFIEPQAGGIGCSPAATAAWLGDAAVRAGGHPCVRYLEQVQARGDGPVPVAAPLPVFERAWVLSTLASVDLVPHPPAEVVRGLHAEFGEGGVAGGAGLPPDADDTATTLTALARLGSPHSVDCLWPYQEPDGHFACFFDERTPSTSTNAHVLEALGACRVPEDSRHLAAMVSVTDWLCERQEPDGSWSDKWHASPYYATACCVLALAEYGADAATDALRKAVDWVLATQRADGSWGRWTGTFEETAYAVQILCRAGQGDAVDAAIARGHARLLRTDGNEPHPPLWHDKDLYTPLRIVRATGIVARRLAETGERGAHSGREPR